MSTPNPTDPPRLSGFLRRHSPLSGPNGAAPSLQPAGLRAERIAQRRQADRRQRDGFVAWSEVRQAWTDPTVAAGLRRAIGARLGSEVASALIDDATVEVLGLVWATETFSMQFHGALKAHLGPLTSGESQALHVLFRQALVEPALTRIQARWAARSAPSPGAPPFGQTIDFRSPFDVPEPQASDPELVHLCQVADGAFNLRRQINFGLPSPAGPTGPAATAGAGLTYDMAWLEAKLQSAFGLQHPSGMSTPEFALVIVNSLSSTRSSDELQTELFELIGFDHFELLQTLITHRDEMVRSRAQTRDAVRSEIIWAATRKSILSASIRGGHPPHCVFPLGAHGRTVEPARPAYGCQVVVQSEEERQLKKQVRKEDRRIQKIMSKIEVDEDEVTQAHVFDPVDRRTKRQVALANAQLQPVIKESSEGERRAPMVQPEQYPFVFDGLSQTKAAAGFVQGVKLALPSGFERKDEKKYEEYRLPAAGAAPVDIGRDLVAIDSLDEIGQITFKGIQHLNRIQSVVFDSAYHTNQNLLVCAPTGAGKTNVAMLCVTQAIRQNIVNGVIKKDNFKIVYVAPMKALAAEMTASFGKKLAPLGVVVRELTGDMQLTKTEIMNTQMLVTTPEKWDVVTRKPGDVSLTQLVRLIIIDEVHLLHGDRGPVVETLVRSWEIGEHSNHVARTLRLVESSQTVIRVVGLSATLPNYIDVSNFLGVSPRTGLFFFDGRFRPVPLAQTFVGVKDNRPMQQMNDMNEICFDKVIEFLKKDKQVMIFVHARMATVKTGMLIREMAQNKGHTGLFDPSQSAQLGNARTSVNKSRNKQLRELFEAGLGFHHAGMLRSDRNLVEKLFTQGLVKVLVCTATLAWGVNLPAHGVIIKGTEIYDAKRGAFVDLGILDVLQIFGRAGRPQFDKSGHGIILTSHEKLSHYLSLMTNQFPIESNFIVLIADNLNAEISLGTVTNVEEGIKWLSYTYLYVRMRKNPLVYGITYQELREDPFLDQKRRDIITDAAKRLDKAKMIRYDERTGYLFATDLGRTASHFYIKYDTVEVFNELMKAIMNEADILAMISKAQEFEQLKVRDDEMDELDDLTHEYCEVPVAGGSENVHGKVNILIQTYISRGRVNSFSLISDQNYVVTNATRIARALFEIVLRKNWPLLAGRLLKFSKTIEKQMWDFENPLKQHLGLKYEILNKLESRNFTLDRLREMDAKEIGHLIHHVKAGADVKKAAFEIPHIELDATIQPITRTVLRVRLKIKPDFWWNDRVHGGTAEPFWVWVEDPENNHIYHHEYVLVSKKQVKIKEAQELVFTIPIFEPLPTQYYIRAISDRWIGSETYTAISFKHLILPERHTAPTDLLDLQPLPVAALQNPSYEQLYGFSHFNAIQTQIFHTLYHSDRNVLLGAPTGSGKTIVAEIAMFKVFRDCPNAKIVYIAPMKALVRERMEDWKRRFEVKLGKKVVELTGDVTPDVRSIKESSVIVTTPEKWDGVSRSWQTRNYVQSVALIVIDEIHLLGEDRGPVLEVIVSRTNFISSHTTRNLRIIGLSTALANARDLADWLGIGQVGLYNFRPSVRPVPLEVHISGFPGKHYCPRMATMNRPAFQAIQQHSPIKPALIFVASRRQTRITAIDLISSLSEQDNPRMWMHLPEEEMESIAHNVKDQNLKHTLMFGIGLHHAGLVERDRKTVEELYVNQKIQVLIATATVAWGVNFPTHLVVIKGTEYFDGKLKRYVDMPITDVLQMMGRAGRPQYDDKGVACVFVHDVKKHFYKKFLYEPFPVESSLHGVLPDHLNAEIVAGTIQSKQEALDYITWTYFFRRLVQNPSYYGLEGVDESNLNEFLTETIDTALYTLEESCCLEVAEDGKGVSPSTLGRIASYYYLSHETLRQFNDCLNPDMTMEDVLKVLCDSKEYAELPVRHNEDGLNSELAKLCPIKLNPYAMDSPHQKTHLLLQSHFCRNPLPVQDYLTDTKSVMDQAIRILQAMIDVTADAGWLSSTLQVQTLLQMIIQARWDTDSSLMCLPHVDSRVLPLLRKIRTSKHPIESLAELIHHKGGRETIEQALRDELNAQEILEIMEGLDRYPKIRPNIVLSSIGGEIHDIPGNTGSGPNWIKVGMDREFTLAIEMKRMNRLHRDGKAFAPKFPKPKDEGWFLVLGCIDNKELVALKRAGSSGRGFKPARQNQLTFFTPDQAGKVIYTLFIMSDAYLGLDQQYDIHLDVVEYGDDDEDEMDFVDDEARFALLREERAKLEQSLMQKLRQSQKANDEEERGHEVDNEAKGEHQVKEQSVVEVK
eukprot:maker-scaffold337_size202799-snap-gene-1.20 protein:Tk05309 transcript:maker-scaffold337_size202799-snap-gene-1.20-mRNA-1 annotation:"activating signal cointegrator 1 complex subunit 3"